MKVSFSAYGHKNVLALHPITIEFTKDSAISKRGDCIIGVSADFSLQELSKLSGPLIRVQISIEGKKAQITGSLNNKFCSNHEIVLRMGGFDSERTLMCRADMAAKDIPRDIVKDLQKGSKMTISIEDIKEL